MRQYRHMSKRRIYDDELHAQFVMFSCYRRRRLLDHARARQVVMGLLATELATHEGICCGFVVMPDHVHAIVISTRKRKPSRSSNTCT